MKTIPQSTNRRLGTKSQGKEALEIRILSTKKDTKLFDQLLGQYHYLGETRPVGDFLRQVAVRDGEWVGLLAWGSACYALKDRDEHIGWTPTQRAERQKLVVQNRRFLIPGKKGHQPNLASKILGAAVRALPDQWMERFGYTPLLAETFTDMEAYKGTCYKASGWTPLGFSKGYKRHRADFYVPNERPKKLWVKPLVKHATTLLCAPDLPRLCQPGAHANAHGVMPLKAKQIDSLYDALRRAPDPRAGNHFYRIGAVLSIVAMALLSGYRDISEIHRFGQRLKQGQRKRLGLPRKKNTQFYRVPSYHVYYQLLKKLDADAFASLLSQWLRDHAGSLPTALAVDGKMIRDTVGIVCLVDHETGVPQAMATMSQKEGEGDRCELKTAQKLVNQMPDLAGKLITGDALNCQVKSAQDIVAQDGNFLLQVKDNQKTVSELAEQKTINLSPPFALTEKEHGRFAQREIVVQAVEPLDVNFPHVRTVIHVRRRFTSKKKIGDWDSSFYLSSEPADSKTPKQWLQTIRDHWGGIEIRNHWRKDACLMEDKTRSRNPRIVGNLILLRNLVLHFFIEHQDTYGSLPAFIEAASADSELALALIQGTK